MKPVLWGWQVTQVLDACDAETACFVVGSLWIALRSWHFAQIAVASAASKLAAPASCATWQLSQETEKEAAVAPAKPALE